MTAALSTAALTGHPGSEGTFPAREKLSASQRSPFQGGRMASVFQFLYILSSDLCLYPMYFCFLSFHFFLIFNWRTVALQSLEKGMATHSSTLAWRIHGQGSLAGYSPRGCRESDTVKRLTQLCNLCWFLPRCFPFVKLTFLELLLCFPLGH